MMQWAIITCHPMPGVISPSGRRISSSTTSPQSRLEQHASLDGIMPLRASLLASPGQAKLNQPGHFGQGRIMFEEFCTNFLNLPEGVATPTLTQSAPSPQP